MVYPCPRFEDGMRSVAVQILNVLMLEVRVLLLALTHIIVHVEVADDKR